MKHILKIAAAAALFTSAQLQAVELGFWATDGWTNFASEDTNDGGGNYYLNPGYGGQAFDAEHLYYKVTGSVLHLGLQTGFDVVDGHIEYGNKQYYAGDLALSFDGATIGDDTSYEYGIDFGLYTKDYTSLNKTVADSTGRVNIIPGAPDPDKTDGEDPAGLYAVSGWNNNVYGGHHISDPFAISNATWVSSLLSNNAGQDGVHYWRTVSLDLSGTGLSLNNVDVHWTMSCGNDAINGNFSVPEPSILSLLGFALLSLGFARRRKSRA